MLAKPMGKRKVGIIIASSITAALGLAVAIPFSVLGIRSGIMDNDYSYLIKENKITTKRLEVPLT